MDDAPATREQIAARIRHAAMDLLARREHSVLELRQKLSRRFDHDLLIAQTIDRLAADNLQSDQRFTEAFVNSRANQGKGPVRIEQELRQRGVAAELISAWLDPSDTHWRELAVRERCKRFGDQAPRESREKARQMRFLQYRGFSQDQIRWALENEISVNNC